MKVLDEDGLGCLSLKVRISFPAGQVPAVGCACQVLCRMKNKQVSHPDKPFLLKCLPSQLLFLLLVSYRIFATE